MQRVRLHVTFSCCRTFIVQQLFPALWWKGRPWEMRRAFRETKGVHMAQYTVPYERKTQRTEPPHPLCRLVSSHSTSDAKCHTSFLPPIFCVSITNQRHLVLGTPHLQGVTLDPSSPAVCAIWRVHHHDRDLLPFVKRHMITLAATISFSQCSFAPLSCPR